jgi:hypothetical protein
MLSGLGFLLLTSWRWKLGETASSPMIAIVLVVIDEDTKMRK